MVTCSFCGGAMSANQEKTSLGLYGKPVCSKNECTAKAKKEADEATESLMTPRDRAITWLARHDFEEQSVRGFWLHKDTVVAVDLNKPSDQFPGLPQIGRLEVNGTITETGHGLSRIDDVRAGIEGALKSRNGAGQKNGNKQSAQQENSTPIQKQIAVVCKNCSKDFLVDEREHQKILNEYGAYFCTSCRMDPARKPRKEAESNLPARQEPAKPPGKPLTDAERDAMIEDAKAKRFLSQRGSSYKVQGKERPDAHQIQRIANEYKISVEILSTAHTDAFVEVKVRAHLNGQFCDAVVHHEFKDEFLLKTMEVLNKNPEILDHWEGTEPVIKEGAKIKVKEDNREILKDAKYFIVHSLLTWKKFSMRDARTKAASIAEAMLLNRDFREPEETQSEEAEAALVQESIKNRKGVSS